MPQLRVVVADGDNKQRFDEIAQAINDLGHEAIQRPLAAQKVIDATLSERADVAFVIVYKNSPQALKLIDKIVREAACPVIAVLDVQDPAFVKEAARLGIFAYITPGEDPSEFQSSIDVVLQRFSQYNDLEGAFRRRAFTERAKGILMERHGIDEHAAFEMLRDQARRTRTKVVDVAEAIAISFALLPHSRTADTSEPNPEA